MTSDVTPRWALPQLFAGQAQKELFHNEALARIDMLMHGMAESADETAPPEAPEAGQCWIVATGATGEWAGRDDAVAGWTEGGWRFATPQAGLRVWVADRGHGIMHDGAAWRDEAVRADGIHLGGVRVVGARQGAVADPSGGATIDSESRAAIGSILAVLRSHGLIAA